MISIGEFTLKKITLLPAFLKLSNQIKEEALSSTGVLHVELKNIGIKTFYSFTAWKTMEEMKAFAQSNIHLKAVKNVADYASATQMLYFESDNLPSIEEAMDRLKSFDQTRKSKYH